MPLFDLWLELSRFPSEKKTDFTIVRRYNFHLVVTFLPFIGSFRLSYAPGMNGFPPGMKIIVYQLRRDKTYISAVQLATQMTGKGGIEPVHGLFGSEQWWKAIATGERPLQTLRGVITKLYMGSMNDWPEFSMRTDSGEESSWSRYANGEQLGQLYEPGLRIELDYVVERHRPKSFDFDAETKCVVEIRLGRD